MKKSSASNTQMSSQTLQHDMGVLKEILRSGIKKLKGIENAIPDFAFAIPKPGHSAYDDFLIRIKPDEIERIVLLLALVPHLKANFFESVILEEFPQGGDLPEIGGLKGNHFRGMMPTGATAAFLIQEESLQTKSQLRRIFSKEHFFSKENVLMLEPVISGEPVLSGRILLSDEYAAYFITGVFGKPDFGPDFPARLITTKMNWSDLVLHPYTADQIEDVRRWLTFHTVLDKDENLSRKISPGYRILFYGPPGTGKTLTATLMGKEFKSDVYRIDLSLIVSKYIGETEKNLNKVFDRAQNKDWILFFDEADALFGKRTSVQNAHDRYANQEISFLLQRIEDFPGLIILASNFKRNIDEAFIRRFHAIIHFPMPNAQERLKLWEQSLPANIRYDGLQLEKLASDYELSGSAIINVMQYACLRALGSPDKTLLYPDLVEGIKREMRKEER